MILRTCHVPLPFRRSKNKSPISASHSHRLRSLGQCNNRLRKIYRELLPRSDWGENSQFPRWKFRARDRRLGRISRSSREAASRASRPIALACEGIEKFFVLFSSLKTNDIFLPSMKFSLNYHQQNFTCAFLKK